MIVINEKSKCCGCEACANACPKNCIRMIEDDEGFLYPQVDQAVCINCHLCEKVCPVINFKAPGEGLIGAYAIRANDSDIRERSSSGGIFYYLAKSVLDKGGSVVAPVFDGKFELHHQIITDPALIDKAMGAKYVQSKIDDVYTEVEYLLKDKKIVYFTGTPCQISGLKKYLRQDYEGLITQDIICHGVPSPGIWNKHIQYLSVKGKIKKVNFRDKSRGWRGYSLKVTYEGGKVYCEPSYREPYLKTYSRDLSSRPSCFECPFKGEFRESDITLGDFWGIEKICPSMDDNKGTSLVIIHTEKGKKLLEPVLELSDFQEVKYQLALSYNKAALLPASPSPNREQFFKELLDEDYWMVMKKYSKDTKLTEVKRLIKGMIRHGK